MATDPDTTMTAAMAAFANLDGDTEPRRAEEGQRNDDPVADDDGTDDPVDGEAEGEDVSAQAGEEPDEGEQEEEPAPPAIDPPARWTEEQKKLWSNVPVDAQQVIAASFKDQERAIGSKSEEAASARKFAEGIKGEAVKLHTAYADQLETYAKAFEPQRPDLSLLATDPQAYAYAQAVYEQAAAQRGEIAQRAAQARQAAKDIQQQQFQQEVCEYHETLTRELGDEWASPEAQKATLAKLAPIASELGYAPEAQGQANANDILALRKAADWKSKADKWDALQSTKMQVVRDAKSKPKVQTPGTAQPKGSERQRGLSESMNRLRQSGDVRDAAAAFSRLR